MIKAKIKAAKSKDEAESLKFTEKNLINKVCMEEALHMILGCTIRWGSYSYFLDLE